MMASHLDMSSEAWNERAMAEALLRKQAGGPLCREFRVTVAASLQLEEKCLTQVSVLLREAQLWGGMPDSSLTIAQRALAYRMISRIGCCVEELLRSEHRRFPVALFRLLATPDESTVAELKATPECVRDAWSHTFLQTYDDNPASEEAMAVLVSVASMLKLDIAEIECRHASIRRHLHTRIQTHVMSFSELSGMWMSQQCRTQSAVAEVGAIGHKLRARRHTSRAAGSANLKRCGPQKRKRTQGGGGGSHRAFVSEQLRVRQLKLPTPGVAAMLWREYRGLTDEQRARYKDVGAVATERARKHRDPKKNSFGLLRRRRGAVAEAKGSQRRAFWQRLQQLPEAEQLDSLVETAIPAASIGEDYLVALGRARSLARQGCDAIRQQQKQHEQVLAQWQGESSGAVATELLTALGIPQDRVQALAQCMRAEPSDHCTVLKFAPAIDKVVGDLVGALHHESSWSKVRQGMEEDQILICELPVVAWLSVSMWVR